MGRNRIDSLRLFAFCCKLYALKMIETILDYNVGLGLCLADCLRNNSKISSEKGTATAADMFDTVDFGHCHENRFDTELDYRFNCSKIAYRHSYESYYDTGHEYRFDCSKIAYH